MEKSYYMGVGVGRGPDVHRIHTHNYWALPGSYLVWVLCKVGD